MQTNLLERGDNWPMELDEAKHHSRTTDDADATKYMHAATRTAEKSTNVCLIQDQWELTCGYFPCGLPKNPVLSIDSFQYYANGELVDFEDYRFITNYLGRCRIEYPNGTPGIDCRGDAVVIQFTVGVESYPEDFVQLISLGMGDWNENRESEIVGTVRGQMSLGWDRIANLLRQY